MAALAKVLAPYYTVNVVFAKYKNALNVTKELPILRTLYEYTVLPTKDETFI